MARPRIFERPGLPPDVLDLDTWAGVDEGGLSERDLIVYRRKKPAITAYFQRRPVREICAEYDIDRNELRRSAQRALEVHDDGRLWGFRALVPWMHVATYTRRSPIPEPNGMVGAGGLSGAFGWLLDQYPALPDYIEREWFGKNRKGDHELALHHHLRFDEMHDRFLRKCIALGIESHQYPFTTETRARESLRHYCKLLEAIYPSRAALERDGAEAGRLRVCLTNYGWLGRV